eukprot:Hpha_TRINITY_DN19083_c0_g1::TRINITY_DN19083_c0_g1_i1::g.138321::m.138321
MEALFAGIDKDGDGFLILREFREFLLKVSPTHAKKYASAIFLQFDDDSDARLDVAEFAEHIGPFLKALHVTPDVALDIIEGKRGPVEPPPPAGGGGDKGIMISTEQWLQLFHVVDADGGGTIGKMELEEMMDVLKPGGTSMDVLALMLEADADGGGDVDEDEFAILMAKIGLPCPMDEAVERLTAHYARKAEEMQRRLNMFAGQKDQQGPKGLSPLEARKRRKSVKPAEPTPTAEPSTPRRVTVVEMEPPTVATHREAPTDPGRDPGAFLRIKELERELERQRAALREESRRRWELERDAAERQRLAELSAWSREHVGVVVPGEKVWVVKSPRSRSGRTSQSVMPDGRRLSPQRRHPAERVFHLGETGSPPPPMPHRRFEREEDWPWARLDDAWMSLTTHWDRAAAATSRVPVVHCTIQPESPAVTTRRRGGQSSSRSRSPEHKGHNQPPWRYGPYLAPSPSRAHSSFSSAGR